MRRETKVSEGVEEVREMRGEEFREERERERSEEREAAQLTERKGSKSPEKVEMELESAKTRVSQHSLVSCHESVSDEESAQILSRGSDNGESAQIAPHEESSTDDSGEEYQTSESEDMCSGCSARVGSISYDASDVERNVNSEDEEFDTISNPAQDVESVNTSLQDTPSDSYEELFKPLRRPMTYYEFEKGTNGWNGIHNPTCNHGYRNKLQCPCIQKILEFHQMVIDPQIYRETCMMAMNLRMNHMVPNLDFVARYKNNKYVILYCSIPNRMLTEVSEADKPIFLRAVNFIRKTYGCKEDWEGYEEMHGEGLTDFTNGLLSFCKEKFSTSTEGPVAVVSQVIAKFAAALEAFCGFVGGKVKEMMDYLMDKITSLIVKVIDPQKLIVKTVGSVMSNVAISYLVYLMILAVLVIMGLIGVKVLTNVMNYLGSLFGWQCDLYAEGQTESTSSVFIGMVTLVGLIIGATKYNIDQVGKKMSAIFNILKGATAIVSIAGMIIMLLPETIRSFLISMGGTDEAKDQLLVEDWMIRATSVLRIRKVNKILTSEEFYNYTLDLIREAQLLRRKIRSTSVGSQFLRMLYQLMEIVSVLEKYRTNKPYRDMPFSLHLAAPPGVGKSLISAALIRDLTGALNSDMYTVPIASEFWDGYHGQRYIIIDEFLIGDGLDRKNMAKMYLELISTKNYQPPMASIDDPTVGIKGTVAEPKLVLTINNKPYETVEGIDKNALQRRRDVVIQVVFNTSYDHIRQGNTVDISQLSEEAMVQRDWLRFNLLPAQPGEGVGSVKALTYTQLVEILRSSFERHNETCERVRASLQGSIASDKSFEELLKDAIRDIRGIPKESKSYLDIFTEFFMKTDPEDGLYGQGDSRPGTSADNRMDDTASSGSGETEFPSDHVRMGGNDWWKMCMEDPEYLFGNRKAHVKTHLETTILNVLRKIRPGNSNLKNRNNIKRVDELMATLESEESEGKTFLWKRVLNERLNAMKELYAPDMIGDSETEPAGKNQKDIIAFLDHSNVDPTFLHRHECLGIVEITENKQKIYCARQFSHKHPAGQNHSFLCKECVAAGRRQHITAVFDPMKTVAPQESKQSAQPPSEGYEYPECSDAERVANNTLWLEIIWQRFKDFGELPLVFELYADRQGEPVYWVTTPWEHATRIMKVSIGIVCVVHGVRFAYHKLVKGDEPDETEELTFAESPRKDKSRTYPVRRKAFYRGFRGQSSKALRISLNGGVTWSKCIPIQGKIFMTYYHGIMSDLPDEDGEKEMLIDWMGKKVNSMLCWNQVVVDEANDLVFITHRAPKMESFPKSQKKFWTRDQMEAYTAGPVTIEYGGMEHYTRAVKKTNVSYIIGETKNVLSVTVKYLARTSPGDCGSALISAGADSPGKIMGFHIAGGFNEMKERVGMAVLVTYEDIIEALKLFDVPVDVGEEMCSQGEGANLEKKEIIPEDEVVFMTAKSKLKPSILRDSLPFEPKKHLPILSSADPRAGGVNVLQNMVDDLVNHDPEPEGLDVEVADAVVDDMATFYRRNLVYPVGRRTLSFTECLAGVPGKLASMNVATSPGFPLCKISNKRGKREWFWFNVDGELEYNPILPAMVDECEQAIVDGEHEGRFLAFMKDELTSTAKIEQKRIRLIYCNDLVVNLVWRKWYGALLAAFNSSYKETPMAIGINQYSFDMDLIHDQLRRTGNQFFAGDFKNMDKRYLTHVTLKLYNLLHELAPWVPDAIHEGFVKNQLKSPIQINRFLIYLRCFQASGGFFTTPLNCLTCEFYLRYGFRKSTDLPMMGNMAFKILGDDHIVVLSQKASEHFDDVKMCEVMKTINQTYTSDDKDRPLDGSFRTFDDLTFLGAHPKMFKGRYLGALKQDTIREMLCWTRNNNATIVQEAETCLEMSAAWGRAFYESMVSIVVPAVQDKTGQVLDMPGWLTMIQTVGSRTAASGADFPFGMVAQGPERSLVKLNAMEKYDSEKGVQPSISLKTKAVNELPATINLGLESRVFRTDLTWKRSDIVGKSIAWFRVPDTLLAYGSSNSIQNYPFDRYMYVHFDHMEVTFQVNGTPFQQGLLAAYFMPLCSFETELPNITTAQHVLIQPDRSNTYTLKVPFTYPKTFLSTIDRDKNAIGTVILTPLSSLAGELESVNISVYTSFHGCEFHMPKGSETTWELPKNEFLRGVDDEVILRDRMYAQGQTISSVTNIANNIAGSAPNQNLGVNAANSGTQDISPSLSVPMPLDNPPLASGAVPVEQSFPGFSSAYGVRPTRDLQLRPSALSRQQIGLFSAEETKIEWLTGRKCLLASFSVKKADMTGKVLYELPLDTSFGLKPGDKCPVNIAVLNQFFFWRGDIELTMRAVQTQYHSSRVQMVCHYGGGKISAANRSDIYSSLMDFSGENFEHTEVIPFNARTEFLRTFEGVKAPGYPHNYSLGTLGFYLMNALKAPESVSDTVEILVFLSFRNVKVAVPRATSVFDFSTNAGGFEEAKSVLGNPILAGVEFSVDSTKVKDGIEYVIPITGWLADTPFGKYTTTSKFNHRYLGVTKKVGITGTMEYSKVGTFSQFKFTTSDANAREAKFGGLSFPEGLVLVPVTGMYAEGDEPDREAPSTNEMVEVNVDSSMTEQNTNDRANIPYQLEIAEKFEFCVTDVHEICRRYVIVDWRALSGMFKSTLRVHGMNVEIQSVPVRQANKWATLYAAWAGSYKYRFFGLAGKFPPVITFQPYDNIQRTAFPFVFDVQQSVMEAGVLGEVPTKVVTTSTKRPYATPLAFEIAYPISTNSYVDVSAPFQTENNFCLTVSDWKYLQDSSGTLSVNNFLGDAASYPLVCAAFGDDMRLGYYRPPRQCFIRGDMDYNVAGYVLT